MPSYIISYDLRKVRDYGSLLAKLRNAGFISPLESVWLGVSNDKAMPILKELQKDMDGDDGLIVIELKPGSDWAVRKLNNHDASVKWLQQNVTP